jgi:ribosomal protein S12 methylthiotransferase accessory factor
VPGYEEESVLSFLADLERKGFVERVGEHDRSHHPQERFLAAWVGAEVEHTHQLRETRLVVAGLEPWGVAAACELVASGIGHLILYDDALLGEDDLLATRAFSPEMVGRGRAQALREALGERAHSTEVTTASLSELELPADGEYDLVMGAFAPDALPSWLALARLCHSSGTTSISGFLQGHEAVIGPLVLPGRTACWNCFRLRQIANAASPKDERSVHDALIEHRAPPRPRAYLATMPPLVGQLLALEVVKFLVARSSPLTGRVLFHDLIGTESALHSVVRVPWCEVCGGGPARVAEAVPIPPTTTELPPGSPRMESNAHGGHDKLDDAEGPDELCDLLRGWVDTRVGVVQGLVVARPKPDEPQLPFLGSAVLSAYGEVHHRRWQPRGGTGKGLTRGEAEISAFGEAIERYSACQWPEAVQRVALADLDGDVLDPRDLALYDDEQYARPDFPYARFDPERVIDWVRGRWLDDGSRVWVPALAAYLYYPAPREDTFCGVTTNGLAAGASDEDAELRATLELLERDSFTLSWLSRSPPRPLTIDDALDDAMAETLRQLDYYAPEIEFYLLDCDVPVFVVACVSFGDGEEWPGAAVALGADLSPTAAVHKAILEQAQVGLSLRRAIRAGNVKPPASPVEIQSEVDHMNYYVPAERAGALDFWRADAQEPVALSELPVPETNGLASLCALLRDSALRVAVADVTAPDVAGSHFRVSRALGPEIQQIHFGHGEAHLANPRLRARTARETNPDPHPLG